MRPKILLIGDKWCGGNKKLGPSEWVINLYTSLQATDLAEAQIFHFDDYYFNTGQRADTSLLQKIAEHKPDIIFFIIVSELDSNFRVPMWSTFDFIKSTGTPIVAIWGDLATPEQVRISKTLLPYTTINIATELTAALVRINRPDKYIYSWVPKDPRIFNNPNKERDIDVVYVGSPRKDRLPHILYLIKHGIKVNYGGGEGHDHLTIEQYTDRYQRSKIALSFARSRVSHVINARPFEVMLCGAMLLEQESFETMKLYTPYIDYVPYTSKKDMLKKAQYYLTYNEERERIARSGQQKTEALYSAKKFWALVINKTLGRKEAENYQFNNKPIPSASLAQLSSDTAWKMKFLNSLCSTNVGFFLYKIFNWRYWQETFREIWHNAFFVPIGKVKSFLEKRMPKKTFEFVLKIKRKIIKTH